MTTEEILSLLRQPAVWDATVRWMTIGLLALMAFGILSETFRQRLRRRREIRTEWETVERIAREKDLTESEWTRLREAIAQTCPAEPLRGITVRHEFDRCIGQAMENVREEGEPGTFEAVGIELRDARVRLGMDYVPYGSRLVSTREILTGLIVWVAPEGDEPLKWRSMRAVDVNEAFFVLEPAAAEKNIGTAPAPGQTLRCRLWRDDDARYVFKVPFARAEGSPARWYLEHTADLDRVQTREFFRIHYEQTVNVVVLEPARGDLPDFEDLVPVTQLRARLTNLSAGGAALLVQQPVPAHVRLRIRLELPATEAFDVDAKIVGTTSIGGGRWVVRTSFTRVSEEIREKLVHFVTMQQQITLAQTGGGVML